MCLFISILKCFYKTAYQSFELNVVTLDRIDKTLKEK